MKSNLIAYLSISDDEAEDVKFEGILYKITTSKKLKKLWFKLLGRDLYWK